MFVSADAVVNIVLFGVAMAIGYMGLLIVIMASLVDLFSSITKVTDKVATKKILRIFMLGALFSMFTISIVGVYFGENHLNEFSLVFVIAGLFTGLLQVGVYISFYAKLKKN